jgi:hypothetical protein
MKKRVLDAACILAEIVLKALVVAVLAIPVMIGLIVAGLLSVLAQAMVLVPRVRERALVSNPRDGIRR